MTNYDQLIFDLFTIYNLAKQDEFHDFRNRHFATPKVELVRRLQLIIDNTKNGDYDQTSDE